MRATLFVTIGAMCIGACASTENSLMQDDYLEGQGGSSFVSTTGSPEGCAVMQLLQENCQTCHGVEPIAGAPMSLVTHDDLLEAAVSDPSVPVFKMIQRRVHDTQKPMPPTGSLSDDEIALIDSWVAAGAPTCAPSTPTTGTGGSTTNPTVSPTASTTSTSPTPTSTTPISDPTVDPDPPPPDAIPAEQCFELRAHGAQTSNDTTAFNVRTGEFYHNFIFQTPYATTVTGLTFDAIVDNPKVVHHFLLFQVLSGGGTDGSHADGLGMHPNSVLITGWAPGGDPPDMPPGVGMEMPEAGGFFELEIHYFNSTGLPAVDRSGLRICVTSQPVANVATVTWLGTETISVPAGAQATAQGTCVPSNAPGGDIHIIQSVPHMHQIGKHMKTVINRAGGGSEVLVDEPFSFLDQRSYETPAVVHPGDTLTTTCTFQNATSGLVLFGPSSTQEMCYNFVVAYPARALAHPGFSIEGSQNTCLW